MGSLQEVGIEPGIVLLRIDRPQRRNALGAQGRVAHENELLEVFQRKGAGLAQGPRPD